MKLSDFELNKEDGTAKSIAEFSSQELGYLFQFALNMAASIGLGAEKHARKEDDFQDTQPQFND